MSLTAEVEIIQNSTLGALSVWSFTNEYCHQMQQARGPKLPLTAIVLPIVFHQETLDGIRNRRFEGGLFTALAQQRSLGIDLQERMESMMPQTMSSLNLCFATRLLTFEKSTGELRSLRKTDPFRYDRDATKHMVLGAQRLGYWCATIDTNRLCSLLKVSF